jgi:hypothetical protein
MPDWRLKSDPVAGDIAIYSKVADITATGAVTIGTGSKTFTVAADLPIAIGDWIWAEPTPMIGGVGVVGEVTAYSGTSLTINVTRAIQSGTYSTWRLTDHTPLYAPSTTAAKQRLQYHSAFPAPATTPALTQQATLNIPALNFATVAQRNYEADFNLFAHGMASPPLVTGRVLDLNGSGNHVGINGSTPVFFMTDGFGTWVEIGANATHVAVRVKAILRTSESRAAQALTIDASVFDVTVDDGLPGNNPAAPLMKYVPGEYLTIGRERIDTRKRYLRQTIGTPEMVISKDETLTIVGSGKTASPSYAQSEVGWRLRYACGGYVKQTTAGWNGSSTNGGTRNADSVPVTK